MGTFTKLKNFARNVKGNIALSFALGSVGLAAVGGGAVDYVKMSSVKSHLQSVSDAAVLVGAKEMQLSSTKARQRAQVASVSKTYILQNLEKNVTLQNASVMVSAAAGTVKLDVVALIDTPFLALVGLPAKKKIQATSTASVLGGLPLCVLSLEEMGGQAIIATGQSTLTATGCTVHANSTHIKAIEAWGQALLNTGLTCSAGGADGGGGNFVPAATTDCPVVPDPLSTRGSPTSTGCDFINMKRSKGTALLYPGVYCGGLILTGSVEAEFMPGIYIIKDGVFEVSGNAGAEGEYVGFFFTGTDTYFRFVDNSEVEFTAPKIGIMAGMLLFEDPNVTSNVVHEITSKDVKKLVGTIYLQKSELHVAVNGSGTGDVASESAFTVIVTRILTIDGKSNLVLNTDFAATDVPVPPAIAQLSGQVFLTK